ncbi:hypothetical protein DTL42_09960 [Bremerella cremea]|uniref:Uncharacterized protein n=1 Tax=Bremerella cremea TaxID=1031537 RepID=A0A368KSA8_9BACT|nr:hypothetical protein [Bremerella cremea]RCS51875.1 hypothetical protein DTL42_09960 [Bremerella cremea]
MARAVLLLSIALLTSSILGCGEQVATDPYGANATPADFGELRLSETVNDPRIKNELERLEANGTLPKQLASQYQSRTDEASTTQTARFFDGTDPDYVDEQLAKSGHWWNVNAPGRELLITTQGEDYLRKWDSQRTAARKALIQPDVRYPIQIEQGYLADPTWVGMMHCLARAELLEAARQAKQDNVDEAVTAVAYAIAYGDQLNQVPILAARNTAAAIREESFVTLRALLRHPKLEAGHLRTLETVLEQSSRAWPDDTELWKVDRACGLHFLEMIRAGHLASLLTREEYDAMSASGELAKLSVNIAKNLTTDQAFYLESMKKVVDSAKEPYYARVEVLNSIADALNQARNSGGYPIVSGDFLLSGMHAQQADLAKDKLRLTIWLTALQMANGHAPKTMPLSEFSGQPIEVRDEPTQVVASFARVPGEIPELIVPKMSTN